MQGKTLTAEAVAELLHRPLYVQGAGDLGVDAHTLEIRLRDTLEIARVWRAVVLIDEGRAIQVKAAYIPSNVERTVYVTPQPTSSWRLAPTTKSRGTPWSASSCARWSTSRVFFS